LRSATLRRDVTLPDIWLTPAQAVYFLVTGDNIAEVAKLSNDLVLGRLRIPIAFVPLSGDAGPEEHAAALKEIRERLATARENPCTGAIRWRDDLLAAGLAAAVGRRTPYSAYETIKAVEFCELKLAGPHARNARGDIVFYNVRMSGMSLWRARRQAIAPDDMAPPAIECLQVSPDRQPVHPAPSRFNDPIWDLRDVIGWVLDRDPAKFGRLYTKENITSALFRLNYTRGTRPEHDQQVLTTVVRALQRGDLVAYDGTNPVARDFWTDKTPQYIRDSTGFLFRREDVLALWPDPRTQISRAPPPITPLRGGAAAAVINNTGNNSRAPNWQKWKYVSAVKLYEAVALSLDIAPEKLRPNPPVWMGGKRFDESEEFLDRLFVAERNLQLLGPLNTPGMRYFDEDPVVGLQRFVAWAVSINWTLPNELVELATDASGGSSPSASRAIIAQHEGAASQHRRTDPEPALRRAPPGHGGRKKGSGSKDDDATLREMLHLLANEQARSVYHASGKVATLAGKSHSRDADRARLRRKFRDKYGTEPPAGKTWRDVAHELNMN
jgi:hypothetical protein